MSRKVLLVVHQERSDPGRVGLRLRTLGYQPEIRRPACGDSLPDSMDDYAGAVMFGGPMSANDDHIDFIRAELDWIPTVVESGKPFLGICLGAQILARALGAKVYGHPGGLCEIGYFRVRATPAGRGIFDDEMHVFQWHREGFDLPAGAERLVEGDWYPNQAIRYGGSAYGLQFHPEVTEALNRLWATRGVARLCVPGAQPRELQLTRRARHDPQVDRWLDRFLPHLMGLRNGEG